MPRKHCVPLVMVMLLGFCLAAPALAQAPAQPPAKAPAAAPAPPPLAKCGPDHAILYKRAVTLLDKAEKKLNARYTAEAKALVKEANALFSILQKECGPSLSKEPLEGKEAQQEAINQKLSADEMAQAERLEKSATEKFKKAQALAEKQPEFYDKLMKEAKAENEQAHNRYIKAEIYALRNQQMVFRFLGK